MFNKLLSLSLSLSREKKEIRVGSRKSRAEFGSRATRDEGCEN